MVFQAESYSFICQVGVTFWENFPVACLIPTFFFQQDMSIIGFFSTKMTPFFLFFWHLCFFLAAGVTILDTVDGSEIPRPTTLAYYTKKPCKEWDIRLPTSTGDPRIPTLDSTYPTACLKNLGSRMGAPPLGILGMGGGWKFSTKKLVVSFRDPLGHPYKVVMMVYDMPT